MAGPNESNPITYLTFGKVYGITVLDTTIQPQPSCRSHYRTTLKMFHGPFRSGDLDTGHNHQRHGQGFPTMSSSVERSQPPLIELVSHHECGSSDHTNPQSLAASAPSNSLSVEWSSNEVTRGSYCLLHIRFPPVPVFENSPSDSLVSISARTERVAPSYPSQPLSSGFEACHAVVKLFAGEEATVNHLRDVDNIQHNIQGLESLIKQVALVTNGLPKRQVVTPTSLFDLSMQPHGSENGAVDRLREIEHIQQELSGLRALLSSMRPVTIFGQHVKGKVVRRVNHEGCKPSGSSDARRPWKVAENPPRSRIARLSRPWHPEAESRPIETSTLPAPVTGIAAGEEQSSSISQDPYKKSRPILPKTLGMQTLNDSNPQPSTPMELQRDPDLSRNANVPPKRNSPRKDVKDGKSLDFALL